MPCILTSVTQVRQSVQVLVHPVCLRKLTIQPINLLVSIHASLKLYIASDHTPLSFSVFERGPLSTTARQLVHALAMHYAAGALFRAGRWSLSLSLSLSLHFGSGCVSQCVCDIPCTSIILNTIYREITGCVL